MIVFLSAPIVKATKAYHDWKMKPLRRPVPPSRHPAAVAAAELPEEAQREADILLSAFSAQSATIDKFATWVLAVIGASATLVVSNIDSITNEIPHYYVAIGLLLLGLASLAGLVEKWLAVVVQAASATGTQTGEDLEKQGSKSPSGQPYDMIDVLDQLVWALPWWLKGKIVKELVRVLGDPLFSSRSNARRTFRQIFLAAIEVLLFVAFIVLMAMGVAN